MKKKTEDGASALRKGLSVLSCFTWTRTHMSLTEIAKEVGLPLPTAARITKALEEDDFLTRDKKTKQYSLGVKCYLLGNIAKKTDILRSVALPYMEELRKRFNETVNLYVREGNFRICYEQIESSLNLKRAAKLGDRYPLWAAASGRCFLAFMDPEEVDRILDEVLPLTDNTIIDRHTVHKRNKILRERGFDTSHSEREEGVSSVAVPIFDVTMTSIACMTVAGPTARLTEKMIDELIPALKTCSYAISLKLGAEEEKLSFLKP